jgi:hypothetical protein
MLCYRAASSFRKRGCAEIGDLATLELSRPLDQSLGLFIYPKAETFSSDPMIVLFAYSHGRLHKDMYVNLTNISMTQ